MIWKEDEELVELFKKNLTLGLLGFDELFNRIMQIKNNVGYPPYNIEKINDNNWCIVIAVAGFTMNDLEIYLDGMQLVVAGKKPESLNENQYIYKGIASRSFQRYFLLASCVDVKNAILENGILRIHISKKEDAKQIIKINIENKIEDLPYK
jgi:molecular chaperone IbpA